MQSDDVVPVDAVGESVGRRVDHSSIGLITGMPT
jgi:hypothetical protein